MNTLEKRILFWALIIHLVPIPIGWWAIYIYGTFGCIIVPIAMVILMIPAYLRIRKL